MSTFLVSWLSKKYGALDASIFLREQPGEWLVLEASRGGGVRAAEPLAARLALHGDRPRYTLGRDPGSDFMVNSPNVDLSHVVLQPDGAGGWTIQRASKNGAAQLDGLELGDFPVALGSGAKIALGDVAFTFYAGCDFHARLAGQRETPPP